MTTITNTVVVIVVVVVCPSGARRDAPPRSAPSTRSSLDSPAVRQTRCALTSATFADSSLHRHVAQ